MQPQLWKMVKRVVSISNAMISGSMCCVLLTHRVAALPLISLFLMEGKLVATVNVHVKAHTCLNTVNFADFNGDSTIKCWWQCILALVYVWITNWFFNIQAFYSLPGHLFKLFFASLSFSGIPEHMKQDRGRHFYSDVAVSHLLCQVFNLLSQLSSHKSGILCPFYKRLIFLCLLSENCWISQCLQL